MTYETERGTGRIIAGVFGLIALALVILGALVVVDHINIAGTNQASVSQQTAPAPNTAPQNSANPAAAPEKKN